MLKRIHDGESTSKIKLNCKDRLKLTQTTSGWLENLHYLKTIKSIKADMSHKKLLEDILDSKHTVVVKISDHTEESLKQEFEIAEALIKAKVPGILNYICYFECLDTFKDIRPPSENICKTSGLPIKVLIMEYIQNESFGAYNWKSIDSFGSCCKQAICTLLIAFLRTGFYHNDFHSKNILIKSTQKTAVSFSINDAVSITIPIPRRSGFVIKILDFETSKLQQSVKDFYKDLNELFNSIRNKLEYDIINAESITPIQIKLFQLQSEAKQPDDAIKSLEIFKNIDEIEFI